jgi:hypothetical protein
MSEPMSEEGKPPVPAPYESGLLSRLVFSHVGKLISRGHSTRLEEHDLPVLQPASRFVHHRSPRLPVRAVASGGSPPAALDDDDPTRPPLATPGPPRCHALRRDGVSSMLAYGLCGRDRFRPLGAPRLCGVSSTAGEAHGARGRHPGRACPPCSHYNNQSCCRCGSGAETLS